MITDELRGVILFDETVMGDLSIDECINRIQRLEMVLNEAAKDLKLTEFMQDPNTISGARARISWLTTEYRLRHEN